MGGILKRRRFVIIILSLAVLIALLTITLLMQKPDKGPSKGIFVIEIGETHNIDLKEKESLMHERTPQILGSRVLKYPACNCDNKEQGGS
ncbi:MAG: hypothetical protein GX992_00830 [Clostridium sp.]|nr:hypothetical protein [Clostridium sp.]